MVDVGNRKGLGNKVDYVVKALLPFSGSLTEQVHFPCIFVSQENITGLSWSSFQGCAVTEDCSRKKFIEDQIEIACYYRFITVFGIRSIYARDKLSQNPGPHPPADPLGLSLISGRKNDFW